MYDSILYKEEKHKLTVQTKFMKKIEFLEKILYKN